MLYSFLLQDNISGQRGWGRIPKLRGGSSSLLVVGLRDDSRIPFFFDSENYPWVYYSHGRALASTDSGET